MRNWGKSYVKWSLALDQSRGPHSGGCGTCTPLVTVDSSTGAVTPAIDYYTLGHFSKFVSAGAVRIYSSNAPGLVSAAFKNPDGSNVLVIYNDTGTPQTAQVLWGSQGFSYSLQALSGATFAWSGAQDAGYTINAATERIEASSYNDLFGLQTESTADTNGGYDLGYADNGDWAAYKNVDFGSGIKSVSVRVASAGSGGTLEFHLNGINGPLIGSATIPITGGWQTWTTVSAAISDAAGVNDLYIVFKGTTNIGNLNWFQFSTATIPVIQMVSHGGKNLIVDGSGFVSGSTILLNQQEQRTIPDDQNPSTRLIGKKSVKNLQPGETGQVQVVNPDGTLSNIVPFTR
jgi:glucosylceramidase